MTAGQRDVATLDLHRISGPLDGGFSHKNWFKFPGGGQLEIAPSDPIGELGSGVEKIMAGEVEKVTGLTVDGR